MKPFIKLFLVFLLAFSSSLEAQVLEELENLNSPFRETNLSITPNGKYLFFMSDRGGQRWSQKLWEPWSAERKNQSGPGYRFDGDIWFSQRAGDGWSDPICLGKVINSSSGEDEPNISTDGQRVYFQSWDNWTSRGGPYYVAKLNGSKWGKPKGLGGAITLFFQDLDKRAERQMIKDLRDANILEQIMILEGQGRSADVQRLIAMKGISMTDYSVGTDGMAISPDERSMVLSVYVPEKKGFDLYFSRINADGFWSYPRAMNVNTPQDEISAFIASDNKTLYFASDRPGGFGGYDIYKTSMEPNGKCSMPQNLGAVYNKGTDEYGFIIDIIEGTGFLVSEGDIYQIGLEEEVKPEESIIVNGKVVNQKGEPLESSILLVNKKTGDTLGISTSNSLSGEYSFAFIRENGDYDQVATTSKGLKGNAAFEVNTSSDRVLEFVIVIGESAPPPVTPTPPAPEVTPLPPPPAPAPEPEPEPTPPAPQPVPEEPVQEAPGQSGDTDAEDVLDTDSDVLSSTPRSRGGGEETTFIINNVQFDADKATLKSSSFPSLDELAQILRSKPDLKFEIGGHTNILPPENYCQELSTNRAETVYTYLIRRGVPSDQITYKGYGKSNPIELDPDLTKQKVNQRVEIKILKGNESRKD